MSPNGGGSFHALLRWHQQSHVYMTRQHGRDFVGEKRVGLDLLRLPSTAVGTAGAEL